MAIPAKQAEWEREGRKVGEKKEPHGAKKRIKGGEIDVTSLRDLG